MRGAWPRALAQPREITPLVARSAASRVNNAGVFASPACTGYRPAE